MTANQEPMTVPITGGAEVHQLFADARAQCWYALSPFGFPAFLRYRDCERLLRDPRFREIGIDMLHLSGITSGPLYDWFGRIMFANEGDAHRRLRSLVSLAFTPRSVESVRAVVVADIDERCQTGGDEVELVGAIAHWMPVVGVSAMLGIPGTDVSMFARWSASLGAVFSAFITPEVRDELEEALVEFTSYVVDLISDRRSRPADDLITRLIEARDGEDRLSEEELVALIVNLVIGGHDATERLIANATYTLLRHPDQWRALVDDSGLVPGAVEEVLRFEPSTGGAGRVATEDVDWDGLVIPEGSMVGAVVIAANRDPEVFTDPDVFDVRRSDGRHLTFGGGPHYCLGANLGRVVAQETLAALVRWWPEAVLIDDEPPWAPPESGFRGITRLRLAPNR